MLVILSLGPGVVLQSLLFLALMVVIYRLSHGNELLDRLSRGAAVLFSIIAVVVLAVALVVTLAGLLIS